MNISSEIQDYLCRFTQLVDYFVVVGPSEETTQAHILSGEELSPSVLSKFPPKSPSLCLPDSFPMVNSTQFCFPFGCSLETSSASSSLYNFILTDEYGQKIYCGCFRIYEVYNSSVFVPKCLVLVSRYPFLGTFKKVLKHFYYLSKQKLVLPLEVYIAHFVLQVPLPPRGKKDVTYRLHNQLFKFSQAPYNFLPELDVNLGLLFHYLSLNHVIYVYKCILLEKSVIFLSENENKLTECSFGLQSLTFPLQWCLVYVPLVPQVLLEYVQSPVSFIFGFHARLKQAASYKSGKDVCIVDLDNNLVNHQKLSFNHCFSGEPFPRHYAKKLYKRASAVLSRFGGNKGNNYQTQTTKVDNTPIKQVFFQFMVSVLKGYKEFINFNWHETSCEKMFSKKAFLKKTKKDLRKFLKPLLKTQMFAQFCQKNIRPKSICEHSECLMFNEHIQAKTNRSKFSKIKATTPFICDQTQKISESHLVPCVYEVYNSENTYSYSKFPKFSLEILEAFGLPPEVPPKLAENEEVPSPQLYIAIPDCKTDEDCILCCWVEMWAACLCYQDPQEHSEILNDLLEVLKRANSKASFRLSPVYKLALEACVRTNPNLCLEIFSFMNKSKVEVDAQTVQILHTTIAKLFKNKPDISVRSTGSSLLTTELQNFKSPKRCPKKKRTFLKGRVSQKSKNKVGFLVYQVCGNCSRKMKFEEINISWSKVPYEYEAACMQCREPELPKIQVKIAKNMAETQGYLEEELFVSPQTLKALVRDVMSDKVYRFNLDIENFRAYNSMIFWNLVYYFLIYDLPFDFIMPYEENYQEKPSVKFSNKIKFTRAKRCK